MIEATAQSPMPWLYPYREDPEETRRRGEPVFRPLVCVSLVNGEKHTTLLDGLVASGTDGVLASTVLAYELGIDLSDNEGEVIYSVSQPARAGRRSVLTRARRRRESLMVEVSLVLGCRVGADELRRCTGCLVEPDRPDGDHAVGLSADPANGDVNGAVDAVWGILTNGDHRGVEDASLDLSLEVAGRRVGDAQESLEPSGLWLAGAVVADELELGRGHGDEVQRDSVLVVDLDQLVIAEVDDDRARGSSGPLADASGLVGSSGQHLVLVDGLGEFHDLMFGEGGYGSPILDAGTGLLPGGDQATPSSLS